MKLYLFKRKLYAKLLNNINIILFVVFFISIYFQIKESDYLIPESINNDCIRALFLKSDTGSSIIISIATGYSVGFFIWFLDVYLKIFLKKRFHEVSIEMSYFRILNEMDIICKEFEKEFIHITGERCFILNSVEKNINSFFLISLNNYLLQSEKIVEYDGRVISDTELPIYKSLNILLPALIETLPKIRNDLNEINSKSDLYDFESNECLVNLNRQFYKLENSISGDVYYHEIVSSFSGFFISLFSFLKVQKFERVIIDKSSTLSYSETCFLKYCGLCEILKSKYKITL